MGCRTNVKNKFRIRDKFGREVLAEFLGTFILIAFGDGAVAQFTLGGKEYGDWNTLTWSWGIAVAMGVWVSGGVSGGHINPAVTLTMCILGRCEWKKLVPYWLAQYIGAIAASACIFGVYKDALDNFDGGVRNITGPTGTAGIWATYPRDFLSIGNGFGDQVFATGLLLLCILAITDKNNMSPPKGMQPFCIGLVVVVIGQTYGYNCGYAINPARDLGPRIFTAMAGWGVDVFRVYENWFWVPFVAPHVGAVLGGWLYQLFVGIHFDPDEGFPEPDYPEPTPAHAKSYELNWKEADGKANAGYSASADTSFNSAAAPSAYIKQQEANIVLRRDS